MKTIKVKQLSVEVGKCTVHSLPYLEYSLKVSINKELFAATTFKPGRGGEVEFGTRLFLRMDNPSLQQISKCSVQVTGMDEKGNKREVGWAQANSKQQGLQIVELQLLEGLAGGLSVQLQFALSVVQVKQSKSINNKLNSFKSHISQKQSSCDQKQSFSSKTTNNFNSTPLLDKYDSQNLQEPQTCTLKSSNSEKVLCNKSEELETSAATARGELKDPEGKYKGEDSQTLLSLQIKIDQLQEKLNEVNNKLTECSNKLEEASTMLSAEKKKNRVLEAEKEELRELLTLEELRNKFAMSHVAKMNALVDQLKKDEGQEIDFIEQKDEIIMINEELELQLAKKNIIISELQAELAQLKSKLTQIEERTHKIEIKHNVVVNEVHSAKKLPYVPAKELEKVKSQKKLFEKNTPSWSKKQQDNAKETTKQTNNTKEQPNKAKQRETQKKKIKKQPEPNKIPLPRQPKDAKVPPAPQARVAKVKSTKSLKPQLKAETQKKSNIQSSLPSLAIDSEMAIESNNLMLNSRALQSLSKQPSHIKNSIQ